MDELYSEEYTQSFLHYYKEWEDIRSRYPEKARFYNNKYAEEFEGFRQLRNYLSHETFLRHDPVAVSRFVVERFAKIHKEMELTALEAATKKIESVSLGSSIESTLRLMVEKSYTYLPILGEKRRLLGVVSLSDLLRLSFREGQETFLKKTVGDYLPSFLLSAPHNEAYGFLSRDAYLYEASSFFSSISEEGSRYGILFITEHGKKDEAVLGILAPIDLLRKEHRAF